MNGDADTRILQRPRDSAISAAFNGALRCDPPANRWIRRRDHQWRCRHCGAVLACDLIRLCPKVEMRCFVRLRSPFEIGSHRRRGWLVSLLLFLELWCSGLLARGGRRRYRLRRCHRGYGRRLEPRDGGRTVRRRRRRSLDRSTARRQNHPNQERGFRERERRQPPHEWRPGKRVRRGGGLALTVIAMTDWQRAQPEACVSAASRSLGESVRRPTRQSCRGRDRPRAARRPVGGSAQQAVDENGRDRWSPGAHHIERSSHGILADDAAEVERTRVVERAGEALLDLILVRP